MFDFSGTGTADINLAESLAWQRTSTAIEPVADQSVSAIVGPRKFSGLETKSEAIPAAIAANFFQFADAELTAQFFTRLVRLAQRREQDVSVGHQLASGSLSHFLKFWKLISDHSKEPEVFLLPNGNIQAEWASEKRTLIIEFRSSGDMFFGVVDGRARLEGAETARRMGYLANLLKSRRPNPLTWG